MTEKLAIDGGKPVRTEPLPSRGLIGEAEKAAAMKVFDDAIASGNAFGYNGPNEDRYEKDFVAFMGGGFADGVNSGTNAVYCALGALQIDPLSEEAFGGWDPTSRRTGKANFDAESFAMMTGAHARAMGVTD